MVSMTIPAVAPQDAALNMAGYLDRIAGCYDTQQQITGDGVTVSNAVRTRGKVRDRWERSTTITVTTTTDKNDTSQQQQGKPVLLALVTTDRQSGFDRQLAVVPYKGAVLNLCSQFWFEATRDIIANHLLATPHPCVSIVRQCQPFPIEFVVRYVLHTAYEICLWFTAVSSVVVVAVFVSSYILVLQFLHDRFNVHFHLEELSAGSAQLLWSRVARRHD
jgi:hypothetical protein